MEKSNKVKQEINTLSQEIKSIIIKLLDSSLMDKIDSKLIRTDLIQKIIIKAEQNENYSTIIKIIEDTIEQIRQFQGILFDIENPLSKLMEERKSQIKLNLLVKDDISKAFDYWMQLYCEALVNWRMDICLKLTQEPYEFLLKFPLGMSFFQDGTKSLEKENYDQALKMLKYLVNNGLRNRIDESLKLTYALVNIFIGRYYLYMELDNKKAKLYFECAKSLAPEDGRSYAALGNYHNEIGNHDEAFKLFEQAIEKSTNQPEGYIGMGLLAEAQERYAEAEDWYNRAIDCIKEKSTIVNRLNMLLAKGSGNLYIQLARFLQEKDPDLALHAVNIALDWVEQKSINEGAAYRLKGEILEKATITSCSEIADTYHEAGKRYYWVNQGELAQDLFYKVHEFNISQNQLTEKHKENYWYLADTLRIQAYKVKYPYVKPDILKESLRIWDEGFNLDKPKIGWPYATRANISERMAVIEKENKRPRLWEAVAYIECALASSDYYVGWWATLIGLYLSLEMEAAASQIMFMHSDDESEKDRSFQEQQLLLLSNIGDYELALEIVEKRLNIEENPWTLAIKGYNKFFMNEYETALRIFEEAIKQYPTLNFQTWVTSNLAICYRNLGLNRKAMKKFNEIREYFDELKDEYIKYNKYYEFGEVAFYLDGLRPDIDYLDFIIDLANTELRNRYKTKSSIYFANLFRGLAYIKKFKNGTKDLENGIKYLERAVKKARSKRDIDYINLMITELERQLNERIEQQPEIYSDKKRKREAHNNNLRVKKELITLQKPLEKRLEYFNNLKKDEVERIKVAVGEIETETERFKRKGKTGDYTWIGLNATLVRWYEITKNWSSKLFSAYEELFKHCEMFPFAEQRLKSTINIMRDEGIMCLEEEKLKEALKLFEQSIELLGLSDSESQDHIDLLSRIGFTYFKMNKKNQVFEIWARVIEIYKKLVSLNKINDDTNPGQFIGNVCLSLLKNTEDCWSLIDIIENHVDELKFDDPHIIEFKELNKKLIDFFNTHFQLKKESTSSNNMISVVTPISVEIGSALIPEDDKNWVFINEYVPDIRDRIEEHIGIRIPGIRVRGNETDLSPNSYNILLNEIPIKSGKVFLNKGYCLESPDTILRKYSRISWEFLKQVSDPITGTTGCWIPYDNLNDLNNPGFKFWKDPMIFIARHLEAVLYQNLDKYLGIQEVENLLYKWEEEDDQRWLLIENALPGQKSRLKFAQILRSLVKEQVPMTNMKEILKIVDKVNLINVNIHEIIRKIRLQLKKQLPGNNERFVHRYIEPIEILEDMLLKLMENKKDKSYIKIPPEDMSEILSIIREFVDQNKKNQVLIIKRAELRHLARNIVEIEFPNLIVIAKEELVKSYKK